MFRVLAIALLLTSAAGVLAAPPPTSGPSKVAIDTDGIITINGERFFPIGIDHYLFEALTTFKDACDFSMTDVYPITANRDVPVSHVGLFVDEARRIHGPNWPHWSYIQIFGGPDTDGGKWAQPLPHEVRCMTFDALVHRANAIMYFSYWPKAPATWASVADLNRELEASVVPWIVAKDGKEIEA